MEFTINNIGRSERFWWLGANNYIIIFYWSIGIVTKGTHGMSLLQISRVIDRNIATNRNIFATKGRVTLVFSIESPLCNMEDLNHIKEHKPLFSGWIFLNYITEANFVPLSRHISPVSLNLEITWNLWINWEIVRFEPWQQKYYYSNAISLSIVKVVGNLSWSISALLARSTKIPNLWVKLSVDYPSYLLSSV